jgi:hypothetical protein
MKNKQHMTAFYIETLLMILVFVGIILALTQVFGQSRNESMKARHLTEAVCLAQNAAEAFEAAETPEDLIKLLDHDQTGHVTLGNTPPGVVCAYRSDMTPDPEGPLRLDMTWQEKDQLLYAQIEVYDEDQSIYRLDTASAKKEAW